jgi:3-carboxy-cis,cis-muconate cycloisomerase
VSFAIDLEDERMSSNLINALATTGPLAELFSDRSLLQAMLDFEAALARAETRASIVPKAAAETISAAAKADNFDIPSIVYTTLRAGTPGIPVASALREIVNVHDPDAARFVHFGTTSQDVTDTALVLLLKRALPLLEKDVDRIEKALHRLSEDHAEAVMLGRTLLQPAPPVTFGLKAGGYLAALRRSRGRLVAAGCDCLLLQFGGASGTLAGLGDDGLAVAHFLAEELALGLPDSPWHAHRDRLANFVAACGVLVGCLGKIARDIILLMQNEIGEALETSCEGRGGSSTMPHKQNPIGCTVALAAAYRLPGLVATFLSSMVQEHERGIGGLQAEWPTICPAIQATGIALESMAEVLEGLKVDPARMRANLDNTGGTIFAERVVLLASRTLGRDKATELVARAVRKSMSEPCTFIEALNLDPEIKTALEPSTLRDLNSPESYLGSASALRRRLLSRNRKEQ